MYDYKFVEADMNSLFTKANYKTIIEEHAKLGWRFVQLLPVKHDGHGKPKLYEIIFERNQTQS